MILRMKDRDDRPQQPADAPAQHCAAQNDRRDGGQQVGAGDGFTDPGQCQKAQPAKGAEEAADRVGRGLGPAPPPRRSGRPAFSSDPVA